MKKKIIKMTCLLAVFVLLTINSVTTYAYIHYNGGYQSYNIPIEKRTTYGNEFDDAVDAWNATPTKVNIYTVAGTGNNWIHDDQYADSWWGLYVVKSRKWLFGDATKFEIRLNRTKLVNQSYGMVKGVIAHELGHALWLGDNPPNVDKTIMSYLWVDDTSNTPQQDDINGVNDKWGNP